MKRSAGNLLLVLLVIPFLSFSQDELHVIGNIYHNKAPLEEVNIKVVEDSIDLAVHKTNKKGKFFFSLSYNKNFTISFNKKDFIPKLIKVNTSIPDFIEPGNQVVALKLELIKSGRSVMNSNSVLGVIKFSVASREFNYESRFSRNTFTNIQMSGLNYSDIVKHKRLLTEEVDEEDIDINLPELSYEEDLDLRKKEFYENIIDERKEMLEKDTLTSEKELKLIKANEEIPFDTTVTKYEHHNMKVTEIIINNDKILRIYHKVKHSWGAVFYFKNYRSISQPFFEIETKYEAP